MSLKVAVFLFPSEESGGRVEDHWYICLSKWPLLMDITSLLMAIYGEIGAGEHWWPCSLLNQENQEMKKEEESSVANVFRRSLALTIVPHMDLPTEALQWIW